MTNENYTPEDIFTLIHNRSIAKDMGTKLIINYGHRQQREAIEDLQNKYGGYSAEIEKAINKINEQLDEMLKSIVITHIHPEGL